METIQKAAHRAAGRRMREDVPAELEVVTGEAIEACPAQAIRRL
ncbi:hypothetical protein AB0K48_46115 [Nonomuraea sp. NPDC055795]